MSEKSVICDFGNRIKFELDCAKNGFVKIYQAPFIDSAWLHARRIDKGSEVMSEDSSLLTIFRNDLDTFYKFGCFFFSDTNGLFAMNDEYLFMFLVKQCKKYKIDKHFSAEGIDAMITHGINKLNKTKSLRKIAI